MKKSAISNQQSEDQNGEADRTQPSPSNVVLTAHRRPPTSERRGIALLVVVSVLTVVAIMGVSFMFSMFLETQVSRQFAATALARYIAEAGISHARSVLQEDRLSTRIDELGEAWTHQFAGHDADVDGDGVAESKWWPILAPASTAGQPAAERVMGHYAALVSDEAAKVNINTALADPAAANVDAPNLTALLERAKIDGAAELAKAIENYRYGPDGKPGIAQVDDDGDGTIDEPDEYQPRALRGDDRRFETLEEIMGVAKGKLDAAALRRLAKIATVYSWEPNVSVSGAPRLNVNTATADELLAALIETGVENPWQMAANLADYADDDLAMSRVSKMSLSYPMPTGGPKGDWTWQPAEIGYYQTDQSGGEPLVWTTNVQPGKAHVLIHGVAGEKVGEVTIQGQTKPSMDDGESFGLLDLTSSVTIRVVCNEPTGSRCAFSGIELVALEPTPGFSTVMVRGIEAVRINELMVSPTLALKATEGQFSPQTSAWSCTGGACSNSGVGQARWSWTTASARPGQYYVRVYGSSSGQTVGEVRINGESATLLHGQRHPKLVTVGADQTVSVAIGKTPNQGTYYFQRLELSLAPDAEYVELINLSDRPIDASGWTLNGEATRGRQARLPSGSVIAAHGLLVAAVDADDTQQGLAGNGISARAAWNIPADRSVVQLQFPNGGMTPDAEWLSTNMPGGVSATLALRNGEATVDEVEYLLPLATVAAFQSLEKGDPTAVHDKNGNGIDDGWYPSLQLFTPGAANDNNGLRELHEQRVTTHDPQREVTILNRPLHSVGELAGLASGVEWHPVSSADLAKFVDRLTVSGIRLETEGHALGDVADWRETLDGYETSRRSSIGTWRWTDVPDGQYRVSLYGWSGEQMAVRWQLAEDVYGEWIPTRTADAQGRVLIGQLTIGLDGSPSNRLTIQVRCDSASGICHANHVMLDPHMTLEGLVNVNTAPLDVLLTLPGMTPAIAQRLIAGRPYGDQEGKARGIGDLLAGSVLGDDESDKLERFRHLGSVLTVRSEVFEILGLGEAFERDRPAASQRIRAVVQR